MDLHADLTSRYCCSLNKTQASLRSQPLRRRDLYRDRGFALTPFVLQWGYVLLGLLSLTASLRVADRLEPKPGEFSGPSRSYVSPGPR
jgi:hypothetical protein